MAAEYTCHRCLKVMGILSKRHTHLVYLRPRQLSFRSFSSTSQKHRSAALLQQQSPNSHLQAQKRRIASSAASHSEAATAQETGVGSTLPSEYQRPLLRPNNLFHPFTKSPSADMRRRASFIKMNAHCPHPSHQQTRVPTSPLDHEHRKVGASQPPAHVDFECPDCGIPVYCSEEHWADDYEAHMEICDLLKQINEDDHDLRSERQFPEFQYPGGLIDDILPNLTNWDTLLYTRQFHAINNERSMRQATRLLTYPLTIASVLHELSPYNIRKGGRLTNEGLKSLNALRYTLHPPRSGVGLDAKSLKVRSPPIRIFILGARAESSIPREVWMQLSYLFPRALFHLIFIGPESMANRDSEFPLPERTPSNPFGAVIEGDFSRTLKISTYVDYYHTLHNTGMFWPHDPYFDCFMLFHPGLGHPASSFEWEETVPQLLETKVPIICTGYTEYDMERDQKWVMERCKGEVDLLMEPGENKFRSLRWDLNDMDPMDLSCGNYGIWAFRGKRYEAQRKGEEEA